MSNNPFLLATGPVSVDHEIRATIVMESEHAAVHAAKAFSLTGILAIASGQTGALSIVVPTGKEVHLKGIAVTATGGPITTTLNEDYTYTGGSAVTPRNKKRKVGVAASTTTCKALANATLSAGGAGLILDTLMIPSATQGQNTTSATNSNSDEWELYPGNYVIAFLNGGGATATIGYKLFWYEI